jgi:hypothetical protein
VLILYFLMRNRRPTNVEKILQASGLALLAIVALGMFALVHVQSRYIGAFVVLLWADVLAAVRLPASQDARRLLAFMGVMMSAFVFINIAAFNFEGLRDLAGFGKVNETTSSPRAGRPSWPGAVAEELQRLGIRPGDKVAVIGYAFDSSWARLARVQIVAEMFDWQAEAFWLGASSLHSKVLLALTQTGAKAIVAERVPSSVSPTNWHRVGDSSCYIYILG